MNVEGDGSPRPSCRRRSPQCVARASAEAASESVRRSATAASRPTPCFAAGPIAQAHAGTASSVRPRSAISFCDRLTDQVADWPSGGDPPPDLGRGDADLGHLDRVRAGGVPRDARSRLDLVEPRSRAWRGSPGAPARPPASDRATARHARRRRPHQEGQPVVGPLIPQQLQRDEAGDRPSREILEIAHPSSSSPAAASRVISPQVLPGSGSIRFVRRLARRAPAAPGRVRLECRLLGQHEADGGG